MSWFGIGGGGSDKKKSSPASSRQRQTGSASGSGGLDFGFDFEASGEIHIDSAELENDAALLAELEGLKSSMGLGGGSAPTSKPKPQPQQPTRQPPPPASKPKPQPPPTSTVLAPTAPVPGAIVDVDEIVASLDGLPIGDDDDEDVHVEVTEEDMQNPDLLRELMHIAGGEIGSGDGDEHGGHEGTVGISYSKTTVSMTEDDNEVTTKSTSTTTGMAEAIGSTGNTAVVSMTSSTSTTTTTSSSVPEPDTALEEKLKAEDPSLLERYIRLEKIRAVNFKKGGESSRAMDSLKAVKALEARYNDLVNTMHARRDAAAAVSLAQSPAKSITPASPLEVMSDSVDEIASLSLETKPQSPQIQIQQPVESPRISTVATGSDDQKLNLAKQRALEFKKAALTAKRAGDMNKAKEMLKYVKMLQDVIDTAEVTGGIPASFDIPSVPSESVSTVVTPSATPVSTPKPVQQIPTTPQTKLKTVVNTTGKTVVSAATSVEVLTLLDDIVSPTLSDETTASTNLPEFLTTKLESQISTCTTVAAYYLKSGKKDRALEFHKLKKGFQSDLVLLKSLIASNTTSTDANAKALSSLGFLYENIEYEIEQQNADLRLDEMEVCVVRAMELGGRSVGVNPGDVESFVVVDVGWPTEEGKAALGRCQTGVVVKESSPVYNFTTKFDIERSRGFQRHLERRRALFEVLHQSRGWGGLTSMFTKPVCLGKASVKLEPLLTKCEIYEVLDLMDATNPRKSTGAKLEVRIRVKTPLGRADIVKKQERWIKVDFNKPSTATTTVTTTQTKSQVVAANASGTVVVEKPVAVVEKVGVVAGKEAAASVSVAQPVKAVAGGESRPVTPAKSTENLKGGQHRVATPVQQGVGAGAKVGTSNAASISGPSGDDVDIEELEMQFL
ncbi:hypothetical protein HDU76_005329, partial [Blyttiomyces sp. JEL0837]